MHATEVVDEDKRLLAAVDYYFMQEDGKRFKVFVPFLPYFYIKCKSDDLIQETSAYLSKKYGGLIRGKRNYLKNFATEIMIIIKPLNQKWFGVEGEINRRTYVQ